MSKGRIIVTGASKGIGAAIAADLMTRGYQPICLSRSGDGKIGRQIRCDMTDEAAVKRTFAEIASDGPVVGLVNNAGVHILGAAATLSTEEFNRSIALNTTAVLVAAREAFPYLKQSQGLIVNIGSFFDRIGVPDNLAYCASKAAVAAISRVLAVEWAKDGIRVVNIAPGYIETDLNRDYLERPKIKAWMAGRIPVAAPGQAAEIARFVGALFVENIRFMTGETIYIDGGQGINH